MLKIATLNTWGIPISTDRERRMRTLSQKIAQSDFDIIALQEVWQMDDLNLILSGARAGGMVHFQHFPSGVAGSGLVTLSRHPIIEADFMRFTAAGSPEYPWQGDYIAGKGVGFVRVQTPETVIDVFNTHLVAQYRPDHLDEHRAHRAAQIYEMARYIMQCNRGGPLVALGDFNGRPDQIGYRVMTHFLGLMDTYAALHPDDPGYTYSSENPYVKSDKIPERIDYVFGGGVKPHEVEILFDHKEIYSDHYGLMTVIEVEPDENTIKQPVPAEIKLLLVEIEETLENEIKNADDRRFFHLQQMGASAFVTAALGFTMRGRLSIPGLMLRFLLLVLATLFTFIKFLFGVGIVSGEINGLKAVDNQIKTQLEHISRKSD